MWRVLHGGAGAYLGVVGIRTAAGGVALITALTTAWSCMHTALPVRYVISARCVSCKRELYTHTAPLRFVMRIQCVSDREGDTTTTARPGRHVISTQCVPYIER
jgi:hypothetical protein